MNRAIETMPRRVRRRALAEERRRRKLGHWGAWRTERFAPGSAGSGWAAEFRRAYVNEVFSVLARDTDMGVLHLAVSSLSGDRPTWWEMQRIKNECSAPEFMAVEIYPPSSDVVDGADMFHLWVLPDFMELPCNLTDTGR